MAQDHWLVVPAPNESIERLVEQGARPRANRVIFCRADPLGAKRRLKMQGRRIPTVIAALLSGMTLCYAAPASAQEPPLIVYGEPGLTRVEHVGFANLDLATSAGARTLESRVGSAVKRVCLFEPEIRLQPYDYHACAAESWSKARPQIAEALATGKTSLGAAIVVVAN
jgi:UrcA family protein